MDPFIFKDPILYYPLCHAEINIYWRLIFGTLFFLEKKTLLLIGMAYLLLSLNLFDNFIDKTSLFFEYYAGILVFIFLTKNNNKKIIDHILLLIYSKLLGYSPQPRLRFFLLYLNLWPLAHQRVQLLKQ